MISATRVVLYGSLGKDPNKEASQPVIEYALTNPTPLKEFFEQIRIPQDRVQLVMINHKTVSLEHNVHPGDRVALFPREYMIFADWKNLRL